MKIRVVIVEDEALLRTTLVQLLQADERFDVVASVSNGVDAVAMSTGSKPDVILMDLQLPGQSGIDATRQIVDSGAGSRIVVLTHMSDDDSLFNAIKAGAIGYLLKDASFEQIANAVLSAHEGDGVLHPGLAVRVMNEFRRVADQPEAQREVFQILSRREVEVLERIAMGRRNKAIADDLFLSERTVKNHVSSILHKLKLNDRAEAGAYAREHGLGG